MTHVNLKGFIIAPIALSMIAGTAIAKDVEKGFYVEGNVGQAKGYATQTELRNEVLALGDVGSLSPISQKRRAWKLGGGYRFDNHFSTALTYTDLGIIELGTSTGNSAVRSIDGLSGKAISLTGAYNQPINDWVNAHVKAGYSALSTRSNHTTLGEGTDSGNNGDWVWGAGMSFDLNENVSLMLDWERYEFDHKVDLVTAGLRYTFGDVQTRQAKPAPVVKPVVQTAPVVKPTLAPVAAPVIKKQEAVVAKALNLNVYFDNDSSELTTKSKMILDNAASKLVNGDVKTISVSGFASALGNEDYNQSLSNERAVTVEKYISNNWNVANGKISVSAYGEEQASSIENNSKDRKVVVEVKFDK